MAKVLTFSRTFPAYHPEAGKQTYFVQQVLNALKIEHWEPRYLDLLINLNSESIKEGKLSHDDLLRFQNSLDPLASRNDKLHTIRSGYRFNINEMASLRVWSAKPYASPQIIFAPEVKILSTPQFMIHNDREEKTWVDIGNSYWHHSDEDINKSILPTVAKNDGLEIQDFLDWFKFPKPFFGQIIAWKEVDYV